MLGVVSAAVVILFSVAADISAVAQESRLQPRESFVLSTASTGGAFHQGGVSLSALIKIKLLPTQQIDLTTSNSWGSLDNIARLADGTSDFAIVQSLLGHYARYGERIAADLGPQEDLRAVTMLWPNVEHFIIRKSLAATGTIDDLLELEGNRISLGRENSAILSNRVLLSNLGLDVDNQVDQALLPFRPSVAAFRNGEIDALSLPASTPFPAFTELMEQLGPEAVLLSWTEEQLRRADNGLGLWSALTLPANSYAEQPDAFETIAQPNFLAVRADVDDDAVYAITRTIFENLPFLARLHAPFQLLTEDNAIAGLPVPLHPGAKRYFDEIGVNVDEPASVAAERGDDKVGFALFGDDLSSPSSIRQRVGQGLIKLITTEDGASAMMVDDLLDTMASDQDLRVLPIRGRGAGHNLADLLYLDGIDVAVLQADALERERGRGVYPDLVENIRTIAKWTDADVHLLVRGDILDIGSLRDQPVNFGPSGSGSEVTAALLFEQMDLAVEQRSDGHGLALKKLKAGQIAGMVYTAPKPAALFDSIEVRDGLRLLPLPSIELSEVYRPSDLTAEDYPSLVFGEKTVSTLAVPLVLATYNWPSANVRYQSIKSFVDSFLDRLGDLQGGMSHEKWQDADPAFSLAGWERHPVVEDYLRQLQAAAAEKAGQGGPLTRAVPGGVGGGRPETTIGRASPENPIIPAKGAARRPVF
jgi:TRAP transporter TAXI family solute receptor